MEVDLDSYEVELKWCLRNSALIVYVTDEEVTISWEKALEPPPALGSTDELREYATANRDSAHPFADGHYRQVTVEHLDRAIQEATGTLPSFEGSTRVGPNLAHSPLVTCSQETPRKTQSPENPRIAGP